MNRSIRISVLIAVLGAPWVGAHAQHAGDYAIRVDNGRIDIGVFESPGVAVFPGVVNAGEFGETGIPGFTDEPGWNSECVGVVPEGTQIGFDIVGAVREWDGSDFDGISGDTITVRALLQDFEAPPTDGTVAGIVFGAGDADGVFHHHLQFFLNLSGGPMDADGVWLLQIELWSPTPEVARSDTLYIVFAQGLGEAEHDEAIAWVEANLVAGGGCGPADLAEPLGVLDFSDVLAFLEVFSAGGVAADLADPAGVFDFSDVLAFLASFGDGCP